MEIVDKAQSRILDRIEKYWSDPYNQKHHVPLVVDQIRKCIVLEPTANELVCLLWWRLHDVWHYNEEINVDHAVIWAEIARSFLQENWIEENIIEQVVHCVRSHRCRDIPPSTLEAKIVAFSDSASHFLDLVYLDIGKKSWTKLALEKLERDYRDLWLLPKLKPNFDWLYNSSKSILIDLEKNNNISR